MYLPAIAGAILVCLGLSKAIPRLAPAATIAVVLLMAATVFAPDLALGLRILAALLTAVLAFYGARQLAIRSPRRPAR